MDFLPLEIKENNVDLESGNFLISSFNNDGNINILDNSKINVMIVNNFNINNVKFNIGKNSEITIGIINENISKNLKFNVNLGANSHLFINLADFSVGENNVNISVTLNGEFSSCNSHIASISDNQDFKDFNINVFHEYPNTFSKVECYGVCKGYSKITISGISHIKNGAIKSSTNQIAKAMIFDPDAIAIAKPILMIDENDVAASHSAAIGKISDEHLYYLTSRGLTVAEARQIITFGYIKPIINKFDEQYKEYINKKIERSL